jgi:AbrB family looped-hinge helix DNA binding protein
MEASIIKVSSKGQIVIPAEWREDMDIEEGEELLAIGEGDILLLKKIRKTYLKKEFEKSVAPLRKKIKRLGATKEDLEEAIRKARLKKTAG